MFVLLFMWALRRDWRAGAILAGMRRATCRGSSTRDRTIYTFYAVAFVPYVVLAVVYVLGLVIGPATRDRTAPPAGGSAWPAGSSCCPCGLFAFFYPLYTAQVIPYPQWQLRMWFPSWI